MMGWRPAETLACTAWEFWQAFAGWRQFNATEAVEDKPEPMTRARLNDLRREYEI